MGYGSEAVSSVYLNANGDVYLEAPAAERADDASLAIFAASPEKKVLAELELGNPISATATAANGVLYVVTMSDLFAVQAGMAEK